MSQANLPVPVEQFGGGVVRQLLMAAIDGTGPLKGAKFAAGGHLAKRRNPDDAVEAVIRTHVAMAGAQGFATNIGGLATIVIALPANIAGAAIVQLRMIACIAHLRGYDIDDLRVRSAIMLTMLGRDAKVRVDDDSELTAHPMMVATAPVFDALLDSRISERVMRELFTAIGGRQALTLVGRRIPLIGSGVGLAADSFNTWQLAHYASEAFADRRHPAG